MTCLMHVVMKGINILYLKFCYAFIGIPLKALNMIIKKNVTTDSFFLIPDHPLTADKDTMFGHKQVAETLHKIILNAEPPFTIGLYGNWGAGKSTIVNLLFARLKKTGIKYVNFDVWKYEQDSLRRQFLIESAKQLLNDDKKVEELKKRFTYKIETTEDGSLKLKWKQLLLKIFFFAFSAFIASEILILSVPTLSLEWIPIIKTIIPLTILLLFIQVLYQVLEGRFLDKVLIIDELTLTKDKVSQPEEFQDEFKNIIEDTDGEKIIFVLDNLDRTNHDKSIELLSTVKTFLEEKQCIFLIPCDEEAIKRHVASVYLRNGNGDVSMEDKKNAENHADEFLRKFFNTIVRIPKSENLELDTYTAKLLKSTKIKELKGNVDLEWIITNSYRSNPREIKQFINSLSSTVLLIEQKISSGDIYDADVLKKNIAFLAKVLIFRQKYPHAYKKLEDKVFNEGLIWEDIEQLSGNDLGDDSALQFIKDSSITPNSIELSFFITLNQSEEEKQLPGWSQFLKAALGREKDKANEFMQTLQKNRKIEIFDYVSSSYLKTNRLKFVRTQPFTSTTINSLSMFTQIKVPKLAKETANQLTNLITKSYEDYPINSVFAILDQYTINGTTLKSITSAYIDLLNTFKENEPSIGKAISIQILSYVSSHPDKFNQNKIIELLKGFYNKKEYLDLFRESAQKDNFLSQPIDKYIDTLKNKVEGSAEMTVDSTLEEMNWLSTPKLLKNVHLTNIMAIIKTLFDREQNKEPADISKRKTIVEILRNYITSYFIIGLGADFISLKDDFDYYQDRIEEWFTNDSTPSYRYSIFMLAYAFWNFADPSRKTRIEDGILKPYLASASFVDGYNNFQENELKDLLNAFPDEFTRAANNDTNIFEKGFEHLNNSSKDIFYLNMTDLSIEKTLDLLLKDIYIPKNIAQILTKIYLHLGELSYINRDKLITLTIKTKCGGNDDNIKKEFYNDLLNLGLTEEGKPILKKHFNNIKSLISRAQKNTLKPYIL